MTRDETDYTSIKIQHSKMVFSTWNCT